MDYSKIGVTGWNGLVGTELLRRGCTPIYANILDDETLHNEIVNNKFSHVIHCAALTNVEYCEEHQKEAFQVNVRGTVNVLNACNWGKSKLIFISSDHVFPGTKEGGYGEHDKLAPVNYYGATKMGAEAAIKEFSENYTIVRTSKLFSKSSLFNEFSLIKDKNEVEYSNRIFKSFLGVHKFSEGLFRFLELHKSISCLHISGSKIVSYYHFMKDMVEYSGVAIDPDKIIARVTLLEDVDSSVVKRPLLGGLKVNKAVDLGLPIYDYLGEQQC